MESCISNIKAWATVNMAKLHYNMTGFMHVTSKGSKHLHNLPTSITICNAQIPFKQSVKKLDFTLDCQLQMNEHISISARTCYFTQCPLPSIYRLLTNTATTHFYHLLLCQVFTTVNLLLFSSTHGMASCFKQIQNYAARVILCIPKSANITTHLKSLHWLPVKVRRTYKIACLCYHCYSSTAPSYVTDMLQKKPSNTCSSSYTMPLLNRPAHSKAILCDHLFYCDTSVWNSIPNYVRCTHYCHHLNLVGKQTYFF